MSSSSNDEGLPAWISNYTSPTAQASKKVRNVMYLSSSSDDDNKPLAQRDAAKGSPTERSPESESQQEVTDDADGVPSESQQRAATAGGKQASSTAKRQPKQTKLKGVLKGSDKAAVPKAAKTPAAMAKAAAATARGTMAASTPAERSGDAERDDLGAATTSPGGATAADGTAAAAKAAVPKLMAAPVAGEVPVMIPDRLSQIKAIAELESIEGGATDLTGDSGAVGRVLIREAGGTQRMQFDLKGIVYNAKQAAIPGSLFVVNIGKTEAKVEIVAHSYLQLVRANPDAGDDESHKYFMDEDEDNYQFNPANDRNATEADGKAAKKKPRKDSKALASRPAGVAKKKPKPKPRAKQAAKKPVKAKARK